MTQQKESPGAGNAEAIQNNHRPTLVSDNLHPRQRWRGNPPRKVVHLSPELLACFHTIAQEVRYGR